MDEVLKLMWTGLLSNRAYRLYTMEAPAPARPAVEAPPTN